MRRLGDGGKAMIDTDGSKNVTINGVRIDMVAKLVGGHHDMTATEDEERIAKRVRRVGEKMEREGFLPELRRIRMQRVMMDEAMATKAPGPVPHINACGCPLCAAPVDGDETSCPIVDGFGTGEELPVPMSEKERLAAEATRESEANGGR